MKYNIFIGCLMILLGLTSCYKDDTSVRTREISNIEIKLPFENNSIIQLEKNQEFIIDPIITQSNGDSELSYVWEINHKIVSTDKVFSFDSRLLGLSEGRLKVSNADGSSFYRFKIRVNSAYEEGLIILSEGNDGEGDFSFIRRLHGQKLSDMDESIVRKNLFSINNPSFDFGKKPTNVTQRSQMIFFSSQEGIIWGLNHNTFEVERMLDNRQIVGFEPTKMIIPNSSARSGLILTKNGTFFEFGLHESVIFGAPNALKNSVVQQKTFFVQGDWVNNWFFWDSNNSQLNLYTEYGLFKSEAYFAGKDLIDFCVHSDRNVYLLLKDKNNPTVLSKVILPRFMDYYDLTGATTNVLTATNTNMNMEAPGVLVSKHVKYLYADNRSVYSWFFTSNNLPSSPFLTINIPGVITALELDPEGDELFVAVYNESASSNKGSVLVYDTGTGLLKKSFLGVSEKPVDLFYKGITKIIQ